MSRAVPSLATALMLAAAPSAAWAQQADSVLGVDAVGGSVSVEHLGVTAVLRPGDRINERDVLRTGADGRLSLRFARLGFMELGPNAEIGIEKLPFASNAADRKSIFSLARGYLRVVWKPLPGRPSWPLYVYFGGQRAGLAAGEYFFDQHEAATRVCIAAGQIAVVPVTGANVDTLPAPSCSKLYVEAAPESAARDPEDWTAMRRDYSIDVTARSPAAPAPQMLSLAPPAVDAASSPAITTEAATSVPATGAVPVPPTPRPPPAVPVSAPAAASSPLPLALPADDGRWTINVASLPDAAAAARQVQLLQTAGYSATVQPVEVRGQTWNRVQLRGFPSADAARARAAEVEQKLGLHNLWVVRQP